MIVPSMTSSSSPPSDVIESNKLTRLDRSLALIIENPDQTPSRQAGITPRIERLHRFHGTSIIFESSQKLELQASTCATACTIFHRFYHSCSLAEYNVWSVALASTLLATKIEEDPKNLKQIIEVYNVVYARRLVLADLQFDESESENEKATETAKNNNNNTKPSTNNELVQLVLSSAHLVCLDNVVSECPDANKRQKICADRLQQQLSKHGPVYKEWHEEISKMESVLLRQLGFTFYWISDSHPHKFLSDFSRALELENDKQFTERAWDYCNDSCRLDLSVRYHPEIIASSAIFLAARDFGIELPMTPRPWWQVFLGNESNKGNDLADVANAILGTCNLLTGIEQELTANDAIDWLVATKGFVRSLVAEGKTFNNSDSFPWFCHKEFFEKEIQQYE